VIVFLVKDEIRNQVLRCTGTATHASSRAAPGDAAPEQLLSAPVAANNATALGAQRRQTLAGAIMDAARQAAGPAEEPAAPVQPQEPAARHDRSELPEQRPVQHVPEDSTALQCILAILWVV